MKPSAENTLLLRKHFDREEEWSKPIREEDEDRALKTIAMIPDDALSVLDVGCGSGLIANRIDGSRLVVGLDLSRIALSRVNRDKVEADSAFLPFKDDYFDIVIAAELLEHLDDKSLDMAVAEFQRVSRKYVLTSVPFEENPWETYVKCAECGLEYSPYGHRQYFDIERMAGLIAAKREKLDLWGSKKVIPSLSRLGQRLLGAYPHHDGAICPRCGSERLQHNILGDLCYRAISILRRRLANSKPDTVLCLYEIK
jgi:ubiquinone/menaquinone biosynthesis C-methylase UbiE